MDVEKALRALYPYAEEYGVTQRLPERGLDGETILAQLHSMSEREDGRWEKRKCSGTM